MSFLSKADHQSFFYNLFVLGSYFLKSAVEKSNRLLCFLIRILLRPLECNEQINTLFNERRENLLKGNIPAFSVQGKSHSVSV